MAEDSSHSFSVQWSAQQCLTFVIFMGLVIFMWPRIYF